MPRQRKEKKEKEVKLKLQQPDRSGRDPTQDTLLELAEKRGLLKSHQSNAPGAGELSDEEPLVGRLGESILWSLSLTMLHFTFDVLVSHQYAIEISWAAITSRAAQAFPIILLLFYSLHPHASPPILLPALPPRIQRPLHQLVFFVGSVCAGSYLIYITNEHGYYAVMKRAPPLGCLWIWSVIELDLLWATGSLLCCIGFLKYGGYSYS